MQKFFITATGTEIGKTFVTAAICWQLRQFGKNVTAIKPVISGYSPTDLNCDSARILKSCGIVPSHETMKVISPWRYEAALAPNMAAAIEGNPVDMNELVAFCRDHAAINTDVAICEGVGGLMAPINNEFTVLDWLQALAWPIILVAGSYLGTISHTLTSLDALKMRGLVPKAVVISESENSSVSFTDTVTTLEKFISPSIAIVTIPRVFDQETPWTQVPSLDRLYSV